MAVAAATTPPLVVDRVIPTTGSPLLDVFTTALAFHLVVDPDAVDALVMQWIQTCELPGGDAAPTVVYARLVRAVIRRMSNGCDVTLFAVPVQRHDQLDFECVFGFLADVQGEGEGGDGGGEMTHLLSLPVTTMSLEASLREVPRIIGDMLRPDTPWARAGEGVRPFALVSDQGIGAELSIGAFAGNRRLAAYMDAVYTVTCLLFRIVELFCFVLPRDTFGSDDDDDDHTTTTSIPIASAHLCQALGKTLLQEAERDAQWRELGEWMMTEAARAPVLLEKLRERRARLSDTKRVWMEAEIRRMTGAGGATE